MARSWQQLLAAAGAGDQWSSVAPSSWCGEMEAGTRKTDAMGRWVEEERGWDAPQCQQMGRWRDGFKGKSVSRCKFLLMRENCGNELDKITIAYNDICKRGDEERDWRDGEIKGEKGSRGATETCFPKLKIYRCCVCVLKLLMLMQHQTKESKQHILLPKRRTRTKPMRAPLDWTKKLCYL